VEQGEIRQEVYGRTLHAATSYDEGALSDIQRWFEMYYTIQFANYPVDEHYLAHGATAVPCSR
jgi:formylmethanofuran dehydrogenase subunit A